MQKKLYSNYKKEMNDVKNLCKKYLQGTLSENDRERLLYALKSDVGINAWLRQSIEMEDDAIPDGVRERVLRNVRGTASHGAEEEHLQLRLWQHRVWQYVAAVVAAVLMMTGIGMLTGHLLSSSRQGAEGLLSIRTGVGERSNVTLPDGTEVQLNTKTTVTYDCSMPNDERRVQVDGEAYFKVAKDAEHPFVVSADGVDVACLGTAFNIRNYGEERNISVLLTEGKVRVSAGDADLTMEPNSRVVFDKGSQSMSKQLVNPDNYICWLNNEIRYNDHTMEEIAAELARNYNIRIVITSDKLREERFTGYLGHSSLRNVLEVLSMTSNARYYFDQDTVVYIYEKN